MNNGTTLIIACLVAVAGCGLPKQPGIADQPVSKVPAMVTLSGLDHTYDGSSKTAEASTDPAGLGVKITYDGGAKAPVNAGTYRVEAVVRDANYEGSAGATMTIAKAPQTITFNALAARTFGDKPFDLDGTASSGLKPAYESSDPAVAAISGKRLKITGAGFATITASQGGDRNHLPAEPVKQTLTVNKAPATVTLSGLEQTYDGKAKAAKVTTSPKGLTVSIAYDGNDAAPVDAGTYTVKALIQDANYDGSAAATMTIAKAPQKITFKALAKRTYGDADLLTGAMTSAGLPLAYTSSDPAVATVSNDQVHIAGAGTTVITASQAGDRNHLPAEPMQQTLTVNKAPAEIMLDDLAQTYDGKPKQVFATTRPGGLKVSFTYDGKETAPVNAGRYTVAGTVQDANYQGSITATMTIAKAPQTITFDALAAKTFGDAEVSPGAITSAGLALTYKSSDPKVAIVSEGKLRIIGAGTATIAVSQAGDSNHLPAAPLQQAIVVNKAPAKVALGSLEHTYDGKPKPAASTTTPGGLFVKITYDGKDKAPVNAGSYTVMAVVQDANYEGSATAAMTIAKAPQAITFNVLAAKTFGDKPFGIVSTLSSGLSAAYESSNPQVAAVSGSEVKIVGAGTAMITAVQAGDGNHLPAEPVQQILTVNKAPAKVTLGSLKQTFDGKPKPATSTTKPDGLTVSFAYDGSDQAPVNAGSYTVAATVQEANYEGSSSGTMTIAKAPQRITFNPLPVMTYSEIPFSIASTVTSGLTATYDSSNASVAIISGDQAMIKGVGTAKITASQAGDSNHLPAEPVQQVLTVKKAPVKVILGDLEQTYDGKPKPATSTTIPDRLTVSITYNEKDKAPVDAGSYAVTATVREANYEGSATSTMTIARAPQTITFNAPAVRSYGDEKPNLLFANVSSGLTATYNSSNPAIATVNGNQVMIKSAGTTTITAYQGGDNNHLPAAPVQRPFTVKKATAWVALSGLDQQLPYDGKPRAARVTTSPPGLNVAITYDGSTTPPVNAGRYKVAATVKDANYEGSAAGTMKIAPTNQKIVFPVLPFMTEGDRPLLLQSTLSSGLTASYESSDPAVAAVSGSQVTITGPGTAMITAYQTGNNNYEAVEPVQQVLIVRGKKPRIVVLPLENLSGKPAPLKEIRQALIDGLVRQGATVLDEERMQQFMAKHRVRYVGGIDTFTSRAYHEEAGMEAVLITSVDQYDEGEPPKIALTCRLVSTGEMPYILWMDSFDLSGDDSPGLFGMGLIDRIGPLQDKALRQVLASVAGFYADRSALKKKEEATFRPKTAYQIPFLDPDRTQHTVAVMPFLNRSKSSKAGDIIALRFVGQLVKNRAFRVLEPGVVRQKLLNYRVIMPAGVAKEQAEAFFNNLQTDLIFMGKILEYQEGSVKMEFEMQVYERKSREMVWSSWSHSRGNDAVLLFDWKRVSNAGALASQMAQSIVQDMTTE